MAPHEIRIACGASSATILPGRGATLTNLRVGNLAPLATTPWETSYPYIRPAVDEDSWVRRWQGGWQLCFPSAGQPSDRDMVPAFHGAASQSPWKLVELNPDGATFLWTDGVLTAERTWKVHDDGASAVTSALTVTPREIVVAEHLILGEGLVAASGTASARLEVDAAVIAPLDLHGSPAGSSRAWPGSPNDMWQEFSSETPSRMGVLSEVSGSAVTVRGPHASATVSWAGTGLDHLLLWEEARVTAEDPWQNAVTALGIEPTTAPHGIGTGGEDGRVLLIPGEPWTWSTRLRIHGGAL